MDRTKSGGRSNARRKLLLAGIAASTGVALSGTRVTAQVETATAVGNQVITVGLGGQFADLQAAVDSITDSSASKRYVILVLPGTFILNDPLTLNGSQAGAGGGKDFISLVGIDRDSCVISRASSRGVLSPVIQAADHCRIANLTVTSSVSRLIHWDTTAGSALTIENCYFPEGGGGSGVSTGINSASRLRVTNCEFGQAHCAVHNASGASPDPPGTFEFIGNVMGAATHVGIDMTSGDSNLQAHIAGNSLTGYGELVRISVTDDSSARLIVYTDLISGGSFTNPQHATRFWNRILFPQTRAMRVASPGLTEGAIATARFGSDLSSIEVGTTTTPGDLYPVVIVERSFSPDPPIRVATGPYAEVLIDAGTEVRQGDAIVTGTLAGQGVVDNAQADLRRILGYALTEKSSGTVGRVVVRLNRVLSW